MKTVLILGNSSGGLYDFRNEFVLELLRNYRVIVSMPDTVKTDLLTAEGCEVVHTDINRRGVNPSEDLKLIRAYRALMKEVRPDLVITYTIKPNVYGGYVCGKLGIPYISTVTGLGSAFEKTGIFLKLIHMLYRKGMKKASCVFFQNSANRKLFEENRLVTGKTRLVSGSGVNLEKNRFEPYPAEGPVRFLYVGRIMREKGIGELLEAAREIHKDPEYSGAEFDILGYCDEDWQETLDEAGMFSWRRVPAGARSLRPGSTAAGKFSKTASPDSDASRRMQNPWRERSAGSSLCLPKSARKWARLRGRRWNGSLTAGR